MQLRSRALLLVLPLALGAPSAMSWAGTGSPAPGTSVGPSSVGPSSGAPSSVDRPSVDGAYLGGVVAGALGDADAASAMLLHVLGTDPDDPGVRAKAFVFSTLAGNRQAARLAPQMVGNPLAAMVLGNAAARRGDWSAALDSYGHVPASPLNELLRPLLTAWAQQGEGRTDLALATLAPLTQGGPIAGIYALHAAMIADLAERGDQAGRLYQQALSLYPGSDLVLVQSYGSFLARSGRRGDAQELVHALVRALPLLSIAEPGLEASLASEPVTAPAQGLARTYLTMASLLQQQQGAHGREAEAFMLRFALDLEPGLASARLLLADVQNAAGEPQAALSTLRLIPPGDPLAPVAALRIGVIGTFAGDRAEARQVLERLVRNFPGRADPLQALGDLLQDSHSYAPAIDAYDRAIRLMNPLHGADWPILFARATAYDRNRQWKQAQSDLQHALQLAPNQPMLLNYLGYSWVERKQDLGDARLMIERALDAKPDDGSIRDSLGWAMLRGGDVADAVQQLERAAEQMPEDPTVNYHLGAAYWAAGRKVEARDQWRWALILHPDKQDEVRIRAALRSSLRAGADPITAADALPLSHP